MNGKHYIGAKAQTANNVYTYPPVSKVILIVDDENIFEAGTDDGFVLEKECPYATQAMADNLLAMLQGYEYQSIEADAARITPTAELGDGITVNGIYTQLAYKNIRFGNAAVVDVAAPGSVEAEHEYQQEGSTSSNTNWKLAQTYSRISKTAEEIRLEVAQTVGELSASFDVQLQSITGRIDGLDGEYTELKLTLDGLTITDSETGTTKIDGGSIDATNLNVSAANITGQLTASQINTTGLKVDAANVTGTLTIGQLPDDVATENDIPTRTSDLTNDSGYQTRSGVVSIIDGTVTADYVEALEVAAATLRGRTIYIQNNSGSSVGYISTSSADSGGSAIDINSYGAGRFEANGNLHFNGNGTVLELVSGYIGCGRTLRPASTSCDLGTSSWLWGDIYATNGTINTSDRNRKTDISYDMSRYEAIFDALKPASFKMVDGTSGRTHTGFISQDIEDALAPCGLTSIDFATFIKSPKVDEEGKVIEGEYLYGLRYDELIAPMVAQIQSLKARVAALEDNK